MTVTGEEASTNDSSIDATNTAPHTPIPTTTPDAASDTAENKKYVRQLLDCKEYPVANGDIIKKGFDSKTAIERCVAYLHVLYQLPVCTRYTNEIITLCICLRIIPIDNNAMLGEAQFMVEFRGMHFNAQKAL